MPSFEPPFKLDPHVAIRTPEVLPVLMARAMHSIVRHESGGNPSAELFIKAFNVAAWTLTTAGRKASNPKPETKTTKKPPPRRRILRKKLAFKQRAGRKNTGTPVKRRITWSNEGTEARLKKGSLDLTGLGDRLEQEAKGKQDTDAVVKDIGRWAKAIYQKNPDRYDKSWWKVNGG